MSDLTAPEAVKRIETLSVELAKHELSISQRALLRGEREALTLALVRGELRPAVISPPPWWQRLGRRLIAVIKLIGALAYAIPAVPALAFLLWITGLFRVYRGNMKW